MTREKYESLPLSMLKALAKSRNMKGISTLRKEALIERMLEEDQKENQKNMEEPAVLKEEKKTETVQDQNQEPQEKREDGMECQNRETSETAPRARTRDRGMSAGKSAVKTESARSTVQERRVSMSVDFRNHGIIIRITVRKSKDRSRVRKQGRK